MTYYADSSFLVSCYVTDANTAKARSYLRSLGSPLPFTPLQSLEVRNALKLGVFRGLFTLADASAAWANVEQDLQTGRLAYKTVNWPLAFRLAGRLADKHSAITGTRSLDVLHVSVARSLRVTEFVSFDERQRRLVVLIGLKVAP